MKKSSVIYLGIVMLSFGSCKPSNETSETQDLLEIKNSKASEGFHTSVSLSCEVENPVSLLPLIENKIYELNGMVIDSELENFKTEEKTERISNDSIVVSYFKNVSNYYQIIVPKKEVNNFLAMLHPLVLKIDKRNISNSEIIKLLKDKVSKSESIEEVEYGDKGQSPVNIKPDMVSLDLKFTQSPKFIEERIQKTLIATSKASLSYRLKEPIMNGFNLLIELIIFILNIWPLYTIIFLIYIAMKYYKSRAIKSA